MPNPPLVEEKEEEEEEESLERSCAPREVVAKGDWTGTGGDEKEVADAVLGEEEEVEGFDAAIERRVLARSMKVGLALEEEEVVVVVGARKAPLRSFIFSRRSCSF